MALQLNLKRPLVIFDIESTGMDIVKDRVVEISIVKLFPDGREEEKTYLVNPTIPIPANVTEIHHISDEDVKSCPTFKEIAKNIAQFIEGCDLAGYNSNKFDIPLLAEEFLRADVDFDLKKRKFIDAQTIFHKMEKRTLKAAYQFYCGKSLDDAHSANADARATLEVLKAQIERYKDTPFEDTNGKISTPVVNDMEALAVFSAQTRNVDFVGRIVLDENDVEIINFGKHKGKPVVEVLKKEPSFYDWVMKGEFPLYTKKVLTAIKIKMLSK